MHSTLTVGRLRLLIQNIERTFRTSHSRLKMIVNIGNLHKRSGKLAHIEQKACNQPDIANPAVNPKNSAQHRQQHIQQVIYHIHHQQKNQPHARHATSVRNGLKENIIPKMPSTVKPYVSSMVRELEMVVLIWSTSLVRRLISSPCWCRSKNASGNCFIFPNSVPFICFGFTNAPLRHASPLLLFSIDCGCH